MTPDTSIDAPVDGPWVVGAVRVFVGLGDIPFANIPIVYTNPDGSTADVVMTGMDGWAQANVAGGGSITRVNYRPNQPADMVTVFDVQPGDVISLSLVGGDFVTSDGSFTVSFPPYPNATSYVVENPCPPVQVTTTTATIQLPRACKRNPLDIRVLALRSGTEEVAYLEQSGIPYVDGGSATLAGAWQPTRPVDVTIQNGASLISIVRKSGPNRTYESSDIGFRPMVQGSAATATFAAPAGRAQYRVMYAHHSSNQFGGAAEVTDGTETTYVRDWNAIRLPAVGAATIDLATRTVTTNLTAQADVMRVGVSYAQPQTVSRSWILIGPVSATVRLPMMPPMFPVMPEPNSVGGVYAIGIYESNRFNGYAEAKADPYRVYNAQVGPVPPVGTTMRYSTWGLFNQ